MGTAVETLTYERQESVVFCKTKAEFGGLSNMAPGFPLRVNGVDILTSEALYQACRFPHLPNVQRLIIEQKSPMTAKMKSKPYRSRSRVDWDAVRVRVMRWCLRVKLAQNWSKFRDLLLATGDRPIVEESKKDEFWGAKARDEETLAGANVLGRLLMELRQNLRGAASESLRRVEPPDIRDLRLFGEPILGLDPGDVRAMIAGDLSAASSVEHPKKPEGDGVIAVPTAGSGSMEPLPGASSTPADGVSAMPYPRRLIEVDLPIKEISAHARKDQNIRKGHLHTMHIWWATRPLASCRAVTLAALLPDPVDRNCPESFRAEARRALKPFTGRDMADPAILRDSLLEFISDLASWENGVNATYVAAARTLVAAAHPEGSPLILDPFAGAGSIPFEVLRLGAQSFAGDINPVAVLINKVSQEFLPKYGRQLVESVEGWGRWLAVRVRKELAPFYPIDSSGNTPLAYIWARTVRCEGPRCGAELPLLGMLWLSRKSKNRVALKYRADPQTKQIHVQIFTPKSESDLPAPISRRFAATCPLCDYTTPYKRVREQIRARRGGAHDSRLLAVIMLSPSGARIFREPTDNDREIANQPAKRLAARLEERRRLSIVPDEPYPDWYSGVFNPGLWNVGAWGDLFTPRQALAMATFVDGVRAVREEALRKSGDASLADAVATCLALVVSNMSHYLSSVSIWASDGMISAFVQGSGMAMRPDFAEANPLMPKLVGGFEYSLGQMIAVLQRETGRPAHHGTVQQASATSIPLPDDSLAYLVTDPPYYAAVPYSDLSDFCYVWLKRMLGEVHPDLFQSELTPKDDELVAYYLQPTKRLQKDAAFFERRMQEALSECRRVLRPGGVAVVIFAHKGTSGWEALLNALLNAGWTVTASWPIDTERAARMRAKNSAVLGSSIHLVCRPRENSDGSLLEAVGDWRAVLRELPNKIQEWMPRLAREGVVGADAIFACLGPALEIFSRYSRVEKASGERVELREYLEQVWAAVAREALSMIFEDADATGLEEDARLTAMWLWTLSTSGNGGGNGGAKAAADDEAGPESEDDEEEGTSKAKPSAGLSLEFDAARKIAQGLGAHLEDLGRVIEIKGDKARLLSVAERTRHLFGKDQAQRAPARRAKKVQQLTLFEELDAAEKDAGWGDVGLPPLGETTLDRVHQAMVLFAAGRGEALKRFLVEEGVGRAATFWKLAQALSALYPGGTDEKRWVDGVLARKKGLGFG